MNYRNIVCPIDGSELTDKVLSTASYLGKISKARLILVNVVEKWYRAEPLATDSKEWKAIHEEWLAEGRKVLEDAVAKIRINGAEHVDTVLSDGDAAYEIVAVAKEKSADLIVMATHRYSPMAKLFMGSVIDHVTKNAPCPVLWVME